MWHFDIGKNRFRTIHPGGRIFDIELSGPQHHNHWALWFRRETPPYRSLLIGRFPTVDAAKTAADEVVAQLSRAAYLLGDAEEADCRNKAGR